MTEIACTIEGVFVGKVQNRWPGKAPSAIHKTRASGAQQVNLLGFEKDAQADLSVHGGVDKAIHHYAADHYPLWEAEQDIAPGSVPAAFGENISTYGMTESDLCIGDVFQMGSAVVQISQGRQPCWKLNRHTDNPKMAFRFQQTGRTGWYYRVLEAGHVEAGDEMHLMDRPNERWTVYRVTRARLTRQIGREDALILADMPELAAGWRDAFRKFAAGKLREDTSSRLGS